MPKIAKERTAIEVKRLTKPGFHAVGGVSGLLLRVSKTGARSWILRTMIGNHRRDIGLGGYPDVTLTQARERARETKDQIWKGVDPIEARKSAHNALQAQYETRKTFAQVWSEFFKKKAQELSAKNQRHWQASIENYALPVIGSTVVADLEMRHIKAVLDPIWTEKTMLAKKLRGRLETVLSFATVHGYRTGDNPARWGDNLKEVLPAPSKVHKVSHFRALPVEEAPGFVEELRKREGIAARAVEFCILTVARSGEVRGARWDEIDMNRKRWTIPAERMKMDRDHVVPLTDAALDVLGKMPRDNELIFPAPRGGMLSDMSMLAVIKRMGFKDKTTIHGFRSTFKDWATEETDVQDFVSEMALAHSVGDEVQKAYKRSDLAAKRLRLMREWARFLGYRLCDGNVVSIEQRR